MRSLHDRCVAHLAYDKRKQSRKTNKEVLARYEAAPHTTPSSKEHERLGVTFDARLFIFLEGTEARSILAIDELFDALVLPRAALEKRELIALGRTIAQRGFEVGN